MKKSLLALIVASSLFACKKETTNTSPPKRGTFSSTATAINGKTSVSYVVGSTASPVISVTFSQPLKTTTVQNAVTFTTSSGQAVQTTFSYGNTDSTLIIQPSSTLAYLTTYKVNISQALQDNKGDSLASGLALTLSTGIDSSDKFPQITDSALLTLVQQQTFNYFWAGANPTSGMARERTSSGNTCATGGTGFGVMAILAGINRNFIARADGLIRIQTLVSFLTNKCTTYHGAFSHWIDGSSGSTIPFSTQDNGGDIVETSYMMQGLLCARQYFNGNNALEDTLRANINALWNAVDWNWYRQGGQNVLTWNWSPTYNWAINVHVQGWCEALITYVLGASSNTSAIPKAVYDDGWAQNGGEKNGNAYYGITLPLGPADGGPMFFAHYSFLGINPNGLSDAYANYWTQDTAHANINYSYCVANPGNYYPYSSQCWGLTASDENNGYSAHSPTNDDGVITPTAAISSLPYTPTQSMNALRFFYYKLGDKIWGQYGFIDAFNLNQVWFDSDCLAIDQGPEIVMIENYRSGMLWNLFMSCPEVKTGMKNLGFSSPYF